MRLSIPRTTVGSSLTIFRTLFVLSGGVISKSNGPYAGTMLGPGGWPDFDESVSTSDETYLGTDASTLMPRSMTSPWDSSTYALDGHRAPSSGRLGWQAPGPGHCCVPVAHLEFVRSALLELG